MNLYDVYQSLVEEAKSAFQRRLIWLTGEQAWCYQQISLLTDRAELTQSFLVWDPALVEGFPELAAISDKVTICARVKECYRYLGTENQCVIYDGFAGINPDSIAQISGTLLAGGCFILVTPAQETWPTWFDPEMDKLWVAPYTKRDVSRNFLDWFFSQLAGGVGVFAVKQYDKLVHRQGAFHQESVHQESVHQESVHQGSVHPSAPIDCYEQQRALVLKIVQHLQAFSDAQVVVTGDRGRGKSALLGLVANAIDHRPFFLTAPTEQAVHSVQHFSGKQIEYRTPDYLLSAQLVPPENGILLIDEAAALPSEILTQLLGKFSQCVFCTTEGGYEGTGQGFKLRFKTKLLTLSPRTAFFSLTHPIRWGLGDPLEDWLNQTLLLKYKADQHEVNNQVDDGVKSQLESEVENQPDVIEKVIFEKVIIKKLLKRPDILRQLFNLLTEAHYRTTPNDLRVLLDSPNIHLWVAKAGSQVTSVCLVAEEGAISAFPEDPFQQSGEALAESMWQGVRRPRGHLIPQALIAQEGLLAAKELKIARVIRIASLASYRRKGNARSMIDVVESWAKERCFQYVGASFSLSLTLVSFWQKLGFTFVRVGNQVDPVTGAFNGMVLKPLTLNNDMLKTLLKTFTQRLLFQRKRFFPIDSQQEVLNRINLSHCDDQGMDSQWVLEQLSAFAYHKRSLESVAYLIYFILEKLQEKGVFCRLQPIDQQLLNDYFIDTKPLDIIFCCHKMSGYRDLVQRLRLVCATLITFLHEEKLNF